MVELADSAHGLKKGPKSDDLSSVGPLDGREGRMGRRARQSEPVYCPFECADSILGTRATRQGEVTASWHAWIANYGRGRSVLFSSLTMISNIWFTAFSLFVVRKLTAK